MIHFGEIDNISENTIFSSIPKAAGMGLISNAYKGISSGYDKQGIHGADAIVLNGGYEFDRDYGDKIIYTGDGGNSPGSLKIVKNQTLEGRNKALVESYKNQLPLRVIRGSKLKSNFAPKSGCSYDGLFYITDIVKSNTPLGYTIYQFVLEKSHSMIVGETLEHFPVRVSGYSERLIRDTNASKHVKKLHDDACQVCGVRLEVLNNKYYSEGAHIQPLGKPYDGPDVESNILCLCPNHHVQFDRHQFSINPNTFKFVGIKGQLRTVTGHEVSWRYLKYHFERFTDYALIMTNVD